MKLNRFLLYCFSTSLLLSSCTKDDMPEVPQVEPIEYDATISMAVDDGGATTRSAGSSLDTPNLKNISRLSLAIFNSLDRLVAFKDSVGKPGMNTNITQIRDMAVPSGEVRAYLLANVDLPQDMTTIGGKDANLAAYENYTLGLNSEKDYNFSMSSARLQFILRRGNNFIGFATDKKDTTLLLNNKPVKGFEILGKTIKLVRNISQLQLQALTLKPSDRYTSSNNRGEEFALDSIYLLNVKSQSRMIADDKGVEVAGSGKEFWWGGAYGNQKGTIKTTESTDKDFFAYDFRTPPEDLDAYVKRYPVIEAAWRAWAALFEGPEGSKKSWVIDKIGKSIYYEKGCNIPILTTPGDANTKRSLWWDQIWGLGTNFFIYENHTKTENPTILVVRGRYKYTPKGALAPIETVGYYAVTVNEDGVSSVLEGGTSFGGETIPVEKLVHRNTVYRIYLTIAGPGSSNPLDKAASANINAKVVVNDWNVVDMSDKVD